MAPTPKPSRDDPLIKALPRTHQWRRRIERAVRPSRSPSWRSRRTSPTPTSAVSCRSPVSRRISLGRSSDGRQPEGLRLAEVLGNGLLGLRSIG